MKLEDLKVYNYAMDIGEEVWNIVIKWNYFGYFNNSLEIIGKMLNNYIKSIGKNPNN